MGSPPFSKEKLERGTGLALRALSSWCWSQDPTLDFHLVSSPVSTTENLPTFTKEESLKYLPWVCWRRKSPGLKNTSSSVQESALGLLGILQQGRSLHSQTPFSHCRHGFAE